MSKKINYKFVAMPIQWLTSNNLSAQEKITLAVILADSYVQKDGLYGCQAGYEEIGNKSGICLRQSKNIINSLITKGYIEKTIRNNRRYSNNLRVRLENLAGDCQDGQGCNVLHPCTDNRECNLKQSGVQFEAIGSATDCTLNKIQEDSRNTRACTREKMEPANVVAGRSMPSRQAGTESAMKADEASQCELEDFSLVEDFRKNFEQYKNKIQLIKIGNDWAVRPYSFFQRNFDEIAGDFGEFFAGKSVKFALMKATTRRPGEIIINF